MITAKEAREKIDTWKITRELTREEREMRKIQKRIDKAVKRHKNSCSIYFYLSESTANWLKSQGYTVTYTDRDFRTERREFYDSKEHFVIISW